MSFIKSLVKKLYTYPPRFAGGLIPNFLGYHILRVLFFNGVFALRRRKILQDEQSHRIYKKLIDDGIVVIPSFFPEDIFLKIKVECDNAKIEIENERTPHISRAVLAADRREKSFIIEKYLANNSFINNIVSAVLRKDILVTPKVMLEESFYHEEDIGRPTTDFQDTLHFDVSYPTVKCLYYLNDVDEGNAAFEYIKGSQKLTLKRLWMEYKMSMIFWQWPKERREKEMPEVDYLSLKKIGMKITPMIGRANTLIIVNTMGLHRRGTHRTTKSRKLLFIDYRELETFKFLKRKFLRRA